MLVYSRAQKTGAVVLTNMGTWTKLMATGLALAEAALEELPADVEAWAPEEAPPAEVEQLLGRWWSEGREFVFSWRRGKLEARIAVAPPERRPTVFEPE